MGKKRRSHKKARKNPSVGGFKKYAKRASKRIGLSFAGLSFKRALSDMPFIQVGMFAAKWAAKRGGDTFGATETDPESWNWGSYLKGALGAVGAALLGGAFKAGSGQKVLEGGLNLMVFKAIENELIAPSEWASKQFGEGEQYVPDEYSGLLLAGETPEGEAFMLGADGEMYPADDQYRMQGSSLEPVGPMGSLQPVGPLGADPYANKWFRS